MNFADAVKSVLTQYAVFSGRARRSEYWWFFLFNVLVSIVVTIIDAAIGSSILGILVSLAFLVPGLAVAVRRLHDTGRSGWWILIALIPLVGAIVLIVFLCTDGEPGPNSHGPSPKNALPPGGYGGMARRRATARRPWGSPVGTVRRPGVSPVTARRPGVSPVTARRSPVTARRSRATARRNRPQ